MCHKVGLSERPSSKVTAKNRTTRLGMGSLPVPNLRMILGLERCPGYRSGVGYSPASP
jgi:hypothetical protein